MLEPDTRPHYPRYEVQLPLSYRIEAPPLSRTGIGWTRDLSEGGACLELLQALAPSTPLVLTLRTYRGGIRVHAAVVWSGAAGTEGRRLHGVECTKIGPEEQGVLRAILRTRSLEPAALLRSPLDVPFRCWPKSTPREVLEGRTGEISRQGLLIHLPRSLPVDTEVALALQGPRKEDVQVEGTIVWGEPSDGKAPQAALHHGVRLAARPREGWETLRDLVAGWRPDPRPPLGGKPGGGR